MDRLKGHRVARIARSACGATLVLISLLCGCRPTENRKVQGYVEGEFVYVASPLAGKLLSLAVQRGSQVQANDKLFVLESTAERALRDESERRVAQSRDRLEDALKGKRPSELASVEAQLQQARAALTFSESEATRIERLLKTRVKSTEEFELARSQRDQNRQRVAQLEAELKTAQLGARTDLIAAAQDDVRALESALVKAEWDVSQKEQSSLQAGLVFDTLYREGEWVPAGRPVVSLLPPRNIKVRAYVPEPRIGSVKLGDNVQVIVDGVSEPFPGQVSFISPRAEFTPPVIYSQESRSKLVFLIEVVFEPDVAAKLHPGQPVDVQWESN